MATPSPSMQIAIAHHHAGRLDAAEAEYRAILAVDSKQSDALHNIGIILIQRQQTQSALSFFKQAIEINTGCEQYWLSFINSLLSVNQPEQAAHVLAQAKQHGFKGQHWQDLHQSIQQVLQACIIRLCAFKAFLGYIAGYIETVAIAEVIINFSPTIDLAKLTAALQELFGTEFGFSPPDTTPTPQTLANLLVVSVAVLQEQAGHPIFTTGQAEPLAEPEQFCLTLPYHNASSVLESLKWSVKTLNSLIVSKEISPPIALKEDYRAILSQLRQTAQASFNNNTKYFFNAAHQENIPYLHLAEKIYQFGYGKNSRRLESSITDATPALAVDLAKDKLFSAHLLRQAGFPVPDHGIAYDVNVAVQIAEKLGYPVVIKPVDLDKGIGVAAGLMNAEAVRRAYAQAAEYSKRILVEKHIDGDDYRISVIDDAVERVTRRTPAHVIGDGISTVQQLLDNTNADLCRKPGKPQSLFPIKVDAETEFLLLEQGVSFTTVPQAGQFIRLARIANKAVGGVTERLDIDLVHPDNLRLAVRVAQCLGLDFAGIDFISPDITLPWHQISCGICEVNAQPGLGTYSDHNKEARYIAILAGILKNTDGRIPITSIIGEQNTADNVAQVLHKILLAAGLNAGVTVSQGSWIGAEQVSWKNLGSFAGGRLLLTNKTVESAIIPTSFAELLQQGTAFDQCDVAALLNTHDENSSMYGIKSPSAISTLNVSALQRTRKATLLNADDPNCLAQRQFLTTQELILVSSSPIQPELLSHIKTGGKAVWLNSADNRSFICFSYQRTEAILLNSDSTNHILNRLFAAALAWALDIPLNTIQETLNNLD